MAPDYTTTNMNITQGRLGFPITSKKYNFLNITNYCIIFLLENQRSLIKKC